MRKILIALGVLLFIQFTSCENESSVLEKPIIELSTDPNQHYPVVVKQVNYNKMIASEDVEKLVFDDSGNSVSITTLKDSVIVFVQGGPEHLADIEGFSGFKPVVLSGYNWTIEPNGFPNHSFIGMHQMHEVNPTVFGSGTYFTPENATQVNNQTLDMIERVIQWLKSKNKVVFLFGHSNGSFIVQKYLISGRTNPSFCIVSGTRLITIQDMLNNYPNYIDFSYTDGTILNTSLVADVAKPYFNVMRYLQMDLNKNYTNLLAGNTMLSKTFYSVGFKDEALGKISPAEENFITNNCPHVYFPDGGHALASLGVVYALKEFRN